MKPEEMDELQHRKAVCFKNPLFGAGTHNADGEFTFLSLHASLFAERSIAALGAHHVPVPIWPNFKNEWLNRAENSCSVVYL